MEFPAVLTTDAYTEYYVDLGEQVKSLQANAIAGNITVDEFFAQYEQLKAQGLQDSIGLLTLIGIRADQMSVGVHIQKRFPDSRSG